MSGPSGSASRSTVSLCGLPIRHENVRSLADRLEDDELAAKLRRAVANGNTIVALSFDERQRIVDVLQDAPSVLVDLRVALQAQVAKQKEREKREAADRHRARQESRRAERTR